MKAFVFLSIIILVVTAQYTPDELYDRGFNYINRTVTGPWCNPNNPIFPKIHAFYNNAYNGINWFTQVHAYTNFPPNGTITPIPEPLSYYEFSIYNESICAFTNILVWQFPLGGGECAFTVEQFNNYIQPPYISYYPPSYVPEKVYTPDCPILD